MSTHLHIGLTQRLPGWELLLEQIGVDWSTIPPDAVPSPQDYSAVIAAGRLSASARQRIEQYVDDGGALVDNTLTGGLPQPVRTLFPSPDDPLFAHIPLVDLHGIVRRYRNGVLGGTVAFATRGRGHIARIGIDVHRATTDTRNKRAMFYAPSGRFPNETVSLVSKGALRTAVTTLLKELHFRRGLPFVHRRLFPAGTPSVFCFRIDSDGGSRQQVRTWCDIADRHAIPMSWYLHLERHDEWLDVLRDYPLQEVGIHSVVHTTYPTFEDNSSNIERARAILDREGFSYCGYAAPYGTWNSGVARAEEHHGFAYASEFSLCYDDVPFFPWLGTRFSSVLQVPIHPICIGSLARTDMTEQDMNDYNMFVLHTKLCDGEPVVMYDHPLHPYTDVLDALFAAVGELGIPAMSFAAYAAWWKRRIQTRPRAVWADRRIHIERTGAFSEDIWLDIWHTHSSQVMMQPGGTACTYAPPAVCRPEIQRRIRDIRRFSRAVLRQTLLDTVNRWRK